MTEKQITKKLKDFCKRNIKVKNGYYSKKLKLLT